ncbi:glycosyltransferase family 1 protein [Actinomadura sp. KC06]|uniref:glycosyltransferase family 4 protein n=1 Tax=Actinomadura sp. KC06 TaxID=2530369 RepID=UPI001A9F9951|nr:glycosyltransferase family 1 protein [Actinomadura sp. KC06]
MKIAIVTESFLPQINGVTGSVCRVLEQLAARGHQALVVAPRSGLVSRGETSLHASRNCPESYAGAPVELLPGVRLPFYSSVAVGVPTRLVTAVLRDFAPDVVHLAAPMVLGVSGLAAAERLGVPAVAVFQTDIAGFAQRYGLRGTDRAVWWWLRRLHGRADRTLVPSTPVLAELGRRGIPRLSLWGRGVDRQRFHPSHRSAAVRAALAPDGEVVVGYVGRLAAEKRPRMLATLAGLPGTRLVLVGDGPEERRLRRMMPDAVFTGVRTGTELSRLMASLDVFVHAGVDDTFCQAIQEALACGVPVVAAAAGGPLDLVRPGVNGLLFAPDDGQGLRAAVSALVADAELRRRLGVGALASVEGRGWDVVCDELFGHYRQVSGGAHTATVQHAGAAAVRHADTAAVRHAGATAVQHADAAAVRHADAAAVQRADDAA